MSKRRNVHKWAVVALISLLVVGMWWLMNDRLHDAHEQVLLDRRGVDLTARRTEPALSPLLLDLQPEASALRQPDQLSLDAELQTYIYMVLARFATEYSYTGGSAVIMDVENGELLSLVSYPATRDAESVPHKALTGLYAPGSAIKPFLAMAALEENIITPDKQILSTGSIELPNPNRPDKPFIFKDWRAHGYVDMKTALGVSSNVYFYAIGGGYEDQPGLGINRIITYLERFGFGSKTGIAPVPEEAGRLPSPARKRAEFNDDWRVADTYLVAIGQHGYEITPLQLARATAAIANNGVLVTPVLRPQNADLEHKTVLPFAPEHFTIVQGGMRYAVMNGTAAALYFDAFPVAAKTGTTEVGNEKKFIHSWVTGYFPTESPRYVFTIMLEQGPRGEEVGAVAAARDVLLWLQNNRPEYRRS